MLNDLFASRLVLGHVGVNQKAVPVYELGVFQMERVPRFANLHCFEHAGVGELLVAIHRDEAKRLLHLVRLYAANVVRLGLFDGADQRLQLLFKLHPERSLAVAVAAFGGLGEQAGEEREFAGLTIFSTIKLKIGFPQGKI